MARQAHAQDTKPAVVQPWHEWDVWAAKVWASRLCQRGVCLRLCQVWPAVLWQTLLHAEVNQQASALRLLVPALWCLPLIATSSAWHSLREHACHCNFVQAAQVLGHATASMCMSVHLPEQVMRTLPAWCQL